MTKSCPPVPPLHLYHLASLLSECPDLDSDIFSSSACPLFTSRKGIDPLFVEYVVYANSGEPVASAFLRYVHAVFDAADKASAVPLPSPATAMEQAPASPDTAAAAVSSSAVPLPPPISAAGHDPAAPTTSAPAGGLDDGLPHHYSAQEHYDVLRYDETLPSGGAATPSPVSAPADGSPTGDAEAQSTSHAASGYGASGTKSSSASESEEEESTVDENGNRVGRVS